MYLPIPTWLLFAFLTIAAFAPVAGHWRGWWLVYFGALMLCSVVISVVAVLRSAREARQRRRKIARLLRQHRNAQKTKLQEAGAAAPARMRSHGHRRIIVASDRPEAHEEIRSGRVGSDDAIVITDRRRLERRHRADPYVVERRRAARRSNDIQSLLQARGWVEVNREGAGGQEPTP